MHLPPSERCFSLLLLGRRERARQPRWTTSREEFAALADPEVMDHLLHEFPERELKNGMNREMELMKNVHAGDPVRLAV